MVTNMVLLSANPLNGEDFILMFVALFMFAIISFVGIIKGDDEIEEFGKFGRNMTICMFLSKWIAGVILMIIERLY